MSEHTPGPWQAYTDSKMKVWLIMPPAIAADTAADAHLIASAPEMLKVLKAILAGVTWAYAEPGHANGLKLMVEHVIAEAEGCI